MKHLTVFAPGKVILFGEHAVVYGQPAVAAPLGVGVTATGIEGGARSVLEVPTALSPVQKRWLRMAFSAAADACGNPAVRVTLGTDLPLSSGLGGSAAVAVALARLLRQASEGQGAAKRLPSELELAERMETEFHGTPSGVDHTTSSLGEVLRFARPAGKPKATWKVLTPGRPLRLLIGLTGPRQPTKETVRGLRERMKTWPRRYRGLLEEMGAIADEGARALTKGDAESLGDAMNVNHGLLSALGVSSAKLDSVVHVFRESGALGAKLTGAGGEGGAVVGLFAEDDAGARRRLSKLELDVFETWVGKGGR